MNSLIGRIRVDLKANVDEKTLRSGPNFFKEKIVFYGVKTSVVNNISNHYWKEVQNLTKENIFSICEELLSSEFMEEAFIVSSWLPNLIDRFYPSDIFIFKAWIAQYIDNWAKCDSFCNHTVGGLIQRYPDIVFEVKNWAKSNSRWLRRSSAVSLILPVRQGDFLKEVFEISSTLLTEKDDLVQKGFGWLLKEASRKHQEEVFDYLLRNKRLIPRTALRYAIELMPKELKAEVMKKT
jgi:3-methyladenine DNA glycosylase AlkD